MGLFGDVKNRLLQAIARSVPGATSLRPALHRLRGVRIGRGVFIGTDVIIETSRPHRISIGDRVAISMRVTIIGHFRARTRTDASGDESIPSVRIEDESFVGPGVIILPNVTIGRGSVVLAGSVVTRSVPSMVMVQGNPARPIARCGIPLGISTPLNEFYAALKPIRRSRHTEP